MDDATQFPEPLDENSSQHLGDGSSSHFADGASDHLADALAGQMAGSLLESQTRADEFTSQDGSLPSDPADARPPDIAGATPELPAEPEGTIEIEWEAEVEAFVKAEAEKAMDTAVGETATAQVKAEENEAAGSTETGASTSESADVALGFESACHCFAGAIGATEEPASDDSSIVDRASEGAPQENTSSQLESEKPVAAAEPQAKQREDRRRRRRAMISAPVRVRGVNVTHDGPVEISTTIDVSRNGILFMAAAKGYYKGMDVAVIFPYSGSPTAIHAEQCGRVVRMETLADGRVAVALALGVGVGEDLVDTSGKKLPARSACERVAVAGPSVKKPLVLAMDPDVNSRVSVKNYLETEGYEVIAVGNVVDACHVLDILQPALVVAEIEGDGLPGAGMPGYDLCVHIKETQRLKRIPVVLTTRSAYPSDYSNAHALGAIVCMAKPYKQERLGHVVRLLAPLQAHKEEPVAGGCKPDPKRKACATPHAGAGRAPLPHKRYDENTNLRRKSRFPSFH